MDYCFCNMTGFEILQRLESIPAVAFEKDAAGILQQCVTNNSTRIKAFLEDASISLKQIHLLTGSLALACNPEGVARHIAPESMHPLSIFQLDAGLFCTSPEETYLTLAQTLSYDTPKDMLFKAEATLAFWGMELCGLYYHDARDESLLERKEPLTSKAKLAAYLDKCSWRKGIVLARKALAHIEDGARSPMEVSCALLLCRNRRIGSIGLPFGEINCTVETEDGPREVDRVWRQFGLGYEYQGREYHTTETRRQEDRRRNALLGIGITIVNIWYEDVAQPRAFDNLSKTLAKRMGKRLRIRDDSFAWRQQVLRSVVLPSLNRFG